MIICLSELITYLYYLMYSSYIAFHVHIHVSVHFQVPYHIQVSCLFHMAFQILERYDAYPHIIHVFLFLDESNLLRNWNHSNRIIKTQVMAFSCQLVDLPILPRDSLHYSLSSALTLYLTLVLCTPLNLRC